MTTELDIIIIELSTFKQNLTSAESACIEETQIWLMVHSKIQHSEMR